MEDTQAIHWEAEEEEEAERPSEALGCGVEPLGRLRIFSSAHGPEKDFPLYLGKNVVGRMPDCSVALPFPSISKQHAVIEILARNKAPVLWDCGSLNGTQTLRPPKSLSPGESHRLRDQDLVVFADVPCQYHRLDVSLPFASGGPLAIERTPKVQGGARPWGVPLAEDSEEEVDPLSERRLVQGPRTTSSPLDTVVPESDEEGSSAHDGPGPSCTFTSDSDTDEEGSQQATAGEASSAAQTEQPEASTAEVQCGKDQHSLKERNSNTGVERGAGDGVVSVGGTLERSQPAGEGREPAAGGPAQVHVETAQPCGFIDSDTDVEDEGVPGTQCVLPVQKRRSFRCAGAERPGASPAGSDADGEEAEAPGTVPLGRRRAAVVIDSDTDTDAEEEVSAALALAHLKESRDADVEGSAPPLAPEQIQASAGQDSDTDMEEGFPAENGECVPQGHTDRARPEKSQPPFGDSPGIPLGSSQASTAGLSTEVEEGVPPGPAASLPQEPPVPVPWTPHTSVEADGGPAALPRVRPEEAQPPPGGDGNQRGVQPRGGGGRGGAGVRRSRPAAGAAAGRSGRCLFFTRRAEAGWGGAHVEQDHLLVSRENLTGLLADTGAPGESSQPQTEEAQPPGESGREPQVDVTEDSADSRGDSEELDLEATQCFVKRESESLDAVQTVQDEPTQDFLSALPQEPGPAPCSLQAPGALDESWEVLATQPFCLGESEASETQPIAAHPEAGGFGSVSVRTTPRDQHSESPVCAEPSGIQGGGVQTAEKGLGALRASAESVTLERGPLARETKELPAEGSGEGVRGEEESAGMRKDREQKQVVARDPQRPESSRVVERASVEKDRERGRAEAETPKEPREAGRQALAREVSGRPAEELAPEGGCEPGGSEVGVPQGTLGEGTRSQGAEGGGCGLALGPEGGAGDPRRPASALIASGGQSGGGGGAPLSPRRQQRGKGHSNCRMPPAEKASRGEAESLRACLPSTAPDASAPVPGPITSQSPELPAPLPLSAPSPSSAEPPTPGTRHSGSEGSKRAPGSHVSSELDPLPAKPKVRPQGSSRAGASPVSFTALEPRPAPLTDQPVTPEPTGRATRGRTRGSSKTPDPAVPTASELQPSTSKDQPVTPEPTARATRGRTRGSSKTPDPAVPTASELQPSTSKDQPVTPEPTARDRTRGSSKTPDPAVPIVPEPTPRATQGRTRGSSKTPDPAVPIVPEPTARATRGRTHGSSKTPDPVVPITPELQPSTSKDQPVTPEPTAQATRGRTRGSSKTPDPVVPITPELQPSTSKDQPVTPKSTVRATRGRTHGSSKTPDPVVPTASELQPSTSKDQPVTPKSTPRGRTHRSSVKTPDPVVPITPEPVTPKSTSRGRTHGSSKTPIPVVPTASELQPSTSKDQPITPEPTARVTRGRSSVKTHQPTEPTAPAPAPPTSADQPATSKAMAQGGRSRKLRSTSAVPVPPTPEFQSPVPTDQPVVPEPTPQANGGRRPRTTRKPGSLAAPMVYEPCSAPLETNSQASRNQRQGAVQADRSLRTRPEPALARVPQVPKTEAAGRCASTPEPQPKASQNPKRPLGTVGSPSPQKRPRRGDGPPKTVFLEEEEDPAEKPGKEEGAVLPGPGKRKRGQAEEEPSGLPSRSLRGTKPNPDCTAPKVLFTGVVDARGEQAVLALGGRLAGSVAEASHLVTDRIRRTVKFLCALGRGLPILSLDWLRQSRRAGCFLPPEEYVVSDPEQEKNFGFSLRDSLRRARERRLLEGYEVHVTPGVQPPPQQMAEIISCCGGTVLPSMPRSYQPRRVVITCPQDAPRCATPLRAGLPVLSPEFLLTGVLRQEAMPEAFVLPTEGMPFT
ncbi:mediator of DNA damage checkpoint protein 1 isoform X2 [Saccopteryx bilineata]|uniref:mediator of DNA damage checkpoint protein 1 isoform X2 n=1 Tax=Saccopteryx bilineata TaxID=59482 RepID=UPI00338E7140